MKERKAYPSISIYLNDQDLVDKLDQMRWREKKSKSEIARIALEEYLVKHGEGNPQFTMNQYIGNPDFMAFPATGATMEHKRAWFESHKKDQDTLQQLAFDIDEFNGLLKQYLIR